ncbi:MULTISPECIES: transglycosylase domain-containing protein [Rhizobium]|uniref:peptidoglycan glycosyltransferase n=1 Tax=Rhizobium rhododendri TaxID=2506430 RepID=A0ABY8IK64_9HYPH|nr:MULTISPECIES: PBP1A family penicillin-binding protein [Rhizobium]MBZ5761694.1 PBP1A family penicillin-binding protein [Rhizobium sp. VS19-DR96]MBZ5767798.1 PBP1A family penicillin-binding protein [Rhizobium sp. VS19-DR129.2]MBZ5773676.1 PBP1A family penicillin-binding protein [Rhizobium sp. VS19-DRK62.2]MBZ5786415.1 PBP1A family penicillin-binding protein [Rhizobium sp. VS19-DR121]MBZ5802168.1 PBP1A family penicillin-binding protein [Rhizobium sp. VS19-DR181]
MQEPIEPEGPSPKRPRRKRFLLLRLDSLIDSTVWNAGFRAAEIWEDITIFFRRFRMHGWKRIVFELLGEGMTLGVAASVVMLALAMPAFESTVGDWRNRGNFAVTFEDRYGNVIGHRGIIHENSVPVDELPDYFVKAVLATEDRRFFDHFGIDVFGLFRALTVNAQAGGVVQGGSTLTQQLAKNLFLSNERSIERKIKEAFLAIWLEANLSKKEILSLYLDRTYMGGGTFGAAAAAQYYFGKNISDVNLAEAAMLAGLFKAPTKYAPSVNLPAARARANDVLSNLVQSGFMTEGQVVAARRNPASVVDRAEVVSPDFFLDWAFDEVQRLSARFAERSLIVRTTIDMSLQKATEDSIGSSLLEYGEHYNAKQGASVLIETGGAVRAMVGGRDYGESQFNRATKALRQPGSSFKIYTYAVAMENGMTPATTIVDAPISWGNWSPHNYENRYEGRVTLTEAIAKSINTIPVRLAKEHFGIQPIREMAKRMGVESPVRNDKTIPIGTSEVTVLDQATAYAVFPSDGLQSRRHGVSEIVGYDGKILYDFNRDEPAAKRVLSEQANASMTQMLTQIPVIGTGRKAALDRGIVVGGKTGTTQAYRDAWFIGFSGNYTCAVWFGNDDYTSTNNMTGGTLPAMTFKKIMDYAHQGIALKAIPGIADPFPAQKPMTTAARKAATDAAASAEPPPVRPRSLSAESTKVLRDLEEQLKTAPPLKGQRVASVE